MNAQAQKSRQLSNFITNDSDSFSEEDAQALLLHGEDILNIAPESVALAWQEWAKRQDVSY